MTACVAFPQPAARAGLPQRRTDDARVLARSLEDRRVDLQISGHLPDDWSLRLFRGLAAARTSVQQGYARRLGTRGWVGQLELDLGFGGRADQDYLALATGALEKSTLPDPKILDFELRESRTLGKCLELRVDAWDAVGLLASVVGRVVGVGLLPAELVLETEGGCAFHQLALQSQPWQPPGPGDERRLAKALSGLRSAH